MNIKVNHRLLAVCIIMLLFSAGLNRFQYSLAAEKTVHVPLQVSFVPGFGTHPSGNVSADFSVNILGGRIAEVRKFEIGSLFNWNTAAMSGVQLSGLANFVEGGVSGVQMSGLANVTLGHSASIVFAGLGNYTGGEMAGLGYAGLANIARQEMAGIYLAGLANVNLEENAGIFFAGLGNYAAGESAGIYFSGLVNMVGDDAAGLFFTGLGNVTQGEAAGIHAAGLLNYSEDYSGIEIGMVNVAQKAYGMQLGIFNYAESLEGLPIGLISFVRNTPLRLDFWWSETAALTVALRSGNGRYYNLLACSANPYQENFHWTVGWGLGREEWLSRNSYLDTDFMIHQVYSGGGGLDGHNLLLKLRALYGYNLHDRLDIYGGPTLNLLFSDNESADNVALWGPENPTWTRGDTGIYFWPGLVVGVRY